jgi:hypothetical protein
MNSDDEDLWRAAVNRLFDQILMLEEKIIELESEIQLIRTKPVMNRAGEEYWEHG